MRILLIEDDKVLADRLVASLTSQNYVVDAVEDGQLGLEYAQSTSYDLILSDVGLPQLNGIDLCQRLRTAGCATPILLMTARDAPDERVRGLDAGADDHLTKPLNLEELHARLRALRRRGEVAATPVLQFGPLRLDPMRCQVTYADQPLKLTPKEYNLLELFLRNPARVFSRGQIIEHLWNFEDPPLEESVKAHVKGLRRKLKQVEAQEWIENVYGLGYRLNPAVLDSTTGQAGALQPDQAEGEMATETELPPALAQDFRQAMGGLWQQYQGLMTQRIEALQAAVQSLAAGPLPQELRQAAVQAAHKLAGVLGMFENDAGTAIARRLENLLEAEPPATDQEIPALIQRLIGLMDLPASAPPNPSPSPSLLLVALDPELESDLQALATALGQRWARADTLAAAQRQVQQAAPEKLVLNIASATQWAESLAFLQGLAGPSAPATVVLTAAETLVDRVAIAQTGIQRLLVQPITAAQIWATLSQTQGRDQLARAQVLVVDDDPLVLAALRPLLEPWGLRVFGLTSPQRFWEMLHSVRPDLLILDVEMPQFSGIDLCQAVRTDPHWQNLPILFLTAHQDRKTVQRVFTAGADDFIAKPILGPELLTRLLNRLDRNQLLRTLSTRDPLTGLLNYTQSRRDLEGLIQQAVTDGSPLALALLRLSDRSTLQEQHGPDVVHPILQHWGYQLQTSLRPNDVAGYWGNGELIVGLPGLDQTAAADRLAPLFQQLRQHILTLPTGERLQPSWATAVVALPPGGAELVSLYRTLSRKAAG